jgi:hypothetical protein
VPFILPSVLLRPVLNKLPFPAKASIIINPIRESAIAITAQRAYLSLIFWITDMSVVFSFKKWMAKIGQIPLWTKCGKPPKPPKSKGFPDYKEAGFLVSKDFKFLLANYLNGKTKVIQKFSVNYRSFMLINFVKL